MVCKMRLRPFILIPVYTCAGVYLFHAGHEMHACIHWRLCVCVSVWVSTKVNVYSCVLPFPRTSMFLSVNAGCEAPTQWQRFTRLQSYVTAHQHTSNKNEYMHKIPHGYAHSSACMAGHVHTYELHTPTYASGEIHIQCTDFLTMYSERGQDFMCMFPYG